MTFVLLINLIGIASCGDAIVIPGTCGDLCVLHLPIDLPGDLPSPLLSLCTVPLPFDIFAFVSGNVIGIRTVARCAETTG